MSDNVMVDIETLGKGNDAAILSIGAVKFNPWGDRLGDVFYVPIDPESSQQHGLKIDASTVMWWMGKDRDAARAEMLKEERVDLASALWGFAQWFGTESLPVWGNGSMFDNVILINAFKAAGVDLPWKYWDDKCYRTVKGMAPRVKLERVGTFHNALDDAKSQATHLQRIYRALRIPK